jgi:hypothetical protein
MPPRAPDATWCWANASSATPTPCSAIGAQERRGWEAAIYRMIGRGALFTPEEIKLMADYLGTDFGPNAKPGAAAK